MDDRDKLGCGIIIGAAAWIAGVYCLLRLRVDDALTAAFGIVGWIVLALFVIKYFRVEKSRDSDRPF